MAGTGAVRLGSGSPDPAPAAAHVAGRLGHLQKLLGCRCRRSVRGDDTTTGWGSVEYTTDLARTAEEHGWRGALLGTGWGRPDTFTVATALAARTTTFKPLTAIRPGY